MRSMWCGVATTAVVLFGCLASCSRVPEDRSRASSPDDDRTAEAPPIRQAAELESAAAPVVLRFEHTATLLPNGTILVAGGTAAGVPQSGAEIYDPRRGTFTPTGSMAVPRAGHTAVLMRNGLVLLFGGTNDSADAEMYDFRSETFATGPTAARTRRDHTATVLDDGRVLLIGGRNADETHSEAELYDPQSDHFEGGPTFAPRHSHTATRLPDGQVLVFGGAVGSPLTTELPFPERYDPTTNTVEDTPYHGNEVLRFDHTATLLANGSLLIAAGSVADTIQGTTSELAFFDPSSSDDPTLLGSDQYRTRHAASLLPNGDVTIWGGWTGSGLDSGLGLNGTYQIVTASGASSTGRPIPTTRQYHTSTLTPQGNVTVIGGGSGTDQWSLGGADFGQLEALGETDSTLECLTLLPGGDVLALTTDGARLYEADSRAFTDTTGAPLAQRSRASATVLRNGLVLVAGGTGTAGPLDSAELYDPTTGTFEAAGDLAEARANHTATLLPSGQVLLVGGLGDNGALDSAELYDPELDAFTPLSDNLTEPRVLHEAVLLPTGEVLIVGGSISQGTAETWDPEAGFQALPNLRAERKLHQITLLPSGQVLVTGGPSFVAVAEVYDPEERRFLPSDSLGELVEHSATLLHSGLVLVAGGSKVDDPYSVADAIYTFDPSAREGRGAIRETSATFERRLHSAVTLADGRVLFAGGFPCELCGALPGELQDALWSDGLGDARRPVVTTAPHTVTAGDTVSVEGAGFVGDTDASGGGTNASPTNHPIAVWRPLSGQGMVYGSIVSWTDTTAEWLVPATALHGPGLFFVVVNGIPSAGVDVLIEPANESTECSYDADCVSGFCTDGVCCDARCDGACEACVAELKGSGEDGVCGAVPPGLSTDDRCELGAGASCDTADECATGVCADGVCCDSSCEGICEACDVPSSRGQCVAVLGEPHDGHGDCGTDDPDSVCQQRTCDGDTRNACADFVGPELECASPSCSEGVASLAASCNRLGDCEEQTTTSCAPYGCDGNECSDGPCEDDDGCHPEFRCREGRCVARGDAECDGDHTVTLADGEQRDCTPFKCTTSGECATRCGSALDCVQGYACNARRQCIPDDVAPSADTGSCAVRGVPSHRRSARWLVVLSLGVAVAARRCSRRRRAARWLRTNHRCALRRPCSVDGHK